MWNALSLTTRDFEESSAQQYGKTSNFFFFLHGKMFFNITLARLRQNCILKSDLFRFNLIASPNCHVVY